MAQVRTIWSNPDIRIVHMEGPSYFVETPEPPGGSDSDDIRLLFCLCGQMQIQANFAGRGCVCLVSENCCGLHYRPVGCQLEYRAQKACEGLLVAICRRRLLSLVEDENPVSAIQALTENTLPNQQVLPLTPHMRSIVNQILYSAFAESHSHLFYTAKILELVGAVNCPEKNFCQHPTSPTERTIVQKTMSCLAANMDNPPSIAALASKAGVSVSKFKQLFPAACGLPPYAYLRKLRMEKALSLLQKEEMNVTEVAYEVGYESISHFTKVFYKYHGLKPSQVRREAAGHKDSVLKKTKRKESI